MPQPESPFHADLRKYYRIEYRTEAPTFRQKRNLWLTNFGLHCVAVHRLGDWLKGLRGGKRVVFYPVKVLHRVLEFLVRIVHHVDIQATIGPGFFIGHVGTIYIGPTVIGRNCSVHHNVTIGVGQSTEGYGVPVIGDDVWIGTGAVLYGKTVIGSRVTIATGCQLSRSLPDECLAAGNPGRVVQLNYDNPAIRGGEDLYPARIPVALGREP